MPDYGAMNPFMGRVGALVDRGRRVIENPIASIRDMVMPTPVSTHDQEIQKMNQQMNDQSVQDANKSFLPRRVPGAVRK